MLNKETIEKLIPSKIQGLPNLSFIPRNKNPIGQSNAYLCNMCSMMMISRYSTWLIGDKEIEIQPRFIMTVNSAEAFQFPIPIEDGCLFC